MLDGDNVRHGLCSDLGFSDSDRKENIRRIGEAAKLMFESGTIVLTAFLVHFKKTVKQSATKCLMETSSKYTAKQPSKPARQEM